MGLAERYGIKRQAPEPYKVDVTTFGRTHHVTCDRLGISVEYEGSYTAAWEHGRKLVERHLREHGPVKIERAPMTDAERAAMIAEAFGGH